MCYGTDPQEALKAAQRAPQETPDPRSVPLGNGLANRARLAIGGRQRQLDRAIEEQSR
jgi:hypothetical protein